MVFDGMADSVCQSVKKAISQHKNGKYYRLQLKLPKHLSKLDNVSDANVAQLAKQADKFIKENDELINEICKHLILAHVKRRTRKKNVYM